MNWWKIWRINSIFSLANLAIFVLNVVTYDGTDLKIAALVVNFLCFIVCGTLALSARMKGTKAQYELEKMQMQPIKGGK